MAKKILPSSVPILAGICLWILFLFEEELANYGIYTLVDYGVHEFLVLIPPLCILLTIIWLVFLLIKSIRAKALTEHMRLFLVLFVACVLQIGYISSQANQMTIVTVASVESIHPTKEEIVIRTSDAQVVLHCPMIIFKLLEPTKEYLITYHCKKDQVGEGRVSLVQLIGT